MKLESIITLILGLTLGGVIGHMVASHSTTENLPTPIESSATAPSTQEAPEEDDDWFEKEEQSFLSTQGTTAPALVASAPTEVMTPEEIQQENQELQQQVYELLEWIDDNLGTGERRSPDGFYGGGLRILGENGKLNPEIATILNLSSSSYDGVSDILAQTYAAMVALREEKMEIRQRRNNGLNIKIPGLREEGDVLKSELENALRAELGDDLYHSFMESTWTDLEKEFFYFGQARESLRFRSYNNKKTGEPTIWYQDRYYFPQGEGNVIIYQHNGTSSNVPADYEQYIEWER